MKKLIAIVALLLMGPASMSAQNANHPYYAQGYGFVADEATVGFAGGVGAEGIFSNGFGLGGEYVKAENPFRENMLSANFFYHFGASRTKRMFEPFVTGGFTRFWVTNLNLSPAGGANLGCGMNIWLAKHVGVRLEGRVTHGGRSLSIEYESGGNYFTAPNNVISFRIGVTFR